MQEKIDFQFTPIPIAFLEDLKNFGNADLLCLRLYHYLMSRTNVKRDHQYKCDPSYETIRRDTGLSMVSISKAIKILCINGWIYYINKIKTDKNFYRSEYILSVQKTIPNPYLLKEMNLTYTLHKT